MDRDIVSAKLETLRRCIQRIKDKTPPSAAILIEDHDLQDIICINLERAVQTCVDLASHIIAESDQPAAESMAETFELLRRLNVISAELASSMNDQIRSHRVVTIRNRFYFGCHRSSRQNKDADLRASDTLT